MMKRYVLAATAIALGIVSAGSASLRAQQGTPAQAAAAVPPAIAPYKATIDQYCVTCHNQRTKTAGLALDGLDMTKLPEHADVWEKAIMKVRGHLMPPPNAKQPEPAAAQALVTWLENSMDQAAAANPNPAVCKFIA